VGVSVDGFGAGFSVGGGGGVSLDGFVAGFSVGGGVGVSVDGFDAGFSVGGGYTGFSFAGFCGSGIFSSVFAGLGFSPLPSGLVARTKYYGVIAPSFPSIDSPSPPTFINSAASGTSWGISPRKLNALRI